MNVVALIPARGGSKRIPRKNILPFAGKPMIAHSIAAARASGLFDRVIVSTDDAEISRIAAEWGAETPFTRPVELANDLATTDDVVLHALKWLEAHQVPVDYACCLYATAPFVRADDLKRGFDIIRQQKATTAFSVTTFAHPILRALRVNARGRVEMFWPEHRTARSQDLPEALHDAGQFYWLNALLYAKERKLFSEDAAPVPLPRWRVQDIDTPEDWERAELIHRALQLK